ncbi:class I SAM-dependent methyltransferase [Saccharopolyspora sp. 5N708]|uniref:class I SAM-dependent methyltransferase n=1 Tax=Saccharopolyspora sp. 5N708 TaxID=3457424 RepID=UPI003FCFBCBB
MDSSAGPERYGDRLFHAGQDHELDRLLALAGALDPASRRHLSALGVEPGWRCLDVGAGPGTVSGWLAEKGCDVVAADRNTRFLDRVGAPGVRAVEADLLDENFDPGLFDLVHSRFTLMHLRERDRLLHRLVAWVRPGGWLVLSDGIELGIASSPNETFRRVITALWHALAINIGTDIEFGRRYPMALDDCGLVDTDAVVHLPAMAAGSPMAEFMRLTLDQCRPEIIATGEVDDAAIDQTLGYLTTPGTWDLSLGMITGWGRKP